MIKTEKPENNNLSIITKKEVNSFINNTDSREERIIDRVHLIIKTFCKHFNVELDCWYFPDAQEGQLGNIKNYMDDNYIHYTFNYKNINDKQPFKGAAIIDKYDDRILLNHHIPTRWLYDNNFEQEIIDGKNKIIKEEEILKSKRKEKIEQRKNKEKQSIEIFNRIKNKLSKEEWMFVVRQLKNKKILL